MRHSVKLCGCYTNTFTLTHSYFPPTNPLSLSTLCLSPLPLPLPFPLPLSPPLLVPLYPLSLPLPPYNQHTVCDDHHFKDEFLFYRFKNDEKPRSPIPKKNSRRNTKGGGGGGNSDDSGSVGEPSDNRQSGSSWGSGEDPTGQPFKQDADE